MILTEKKLLAKGTSSEVLANFRSLFGDRMDVTAEICQKYSFEFKWIWARGNLLSRRGQLPHERIHQQLLNSTSITQSIDRRAIAFAIAYNEDQKSLRKIRLSFIGFFLVAAIVVTISRS